MTQIFGPEAVIDEAKLKEILADIRKADATDFDDIVHLSIWREAAKNGFAFQPEIASKYRNARDIKPLNNSEIDFELNKSIAVRKGGVKAAAATGVGIIVGIAFFVKSEQPIVSSLGFIVAATVIAGGSFVAHTLFRNNRMAARDKKIAEKIQKTNLDAATFITSATSDAITADHMQQIMGACTAKLSESEFGRAMLVRHDVNGINSGGNGADSFGLTRSPHIPEARRQNDSNTFAIYHVL